jgi:5'-nucleotidase/UDP-sugar diphosphatase
MMVVRKQLVVFLVLLALLVSLAPAAAQDGGEFTLTVLHTNDVHGRIDEFDGQGNTCDEEEAAAGECFGGVARRMTMVNQVRSESPNVVLLDAGDQFQGTLFYTQYKGGAAQEMMNALGYDAMAVGNHEFDDGPGTLGSFIRGVNFPVLSANIDDSAEPELAGAIQPYTIVDVNGEQVGVIGYTTEDAAILSSPGPNVVFNNIEENVQAAVDELTAQGVNKIVAVSHAGFARDRQVAQQVTGLDVIVAGHTHTYLSNEDEDAEGPYPVVVDGPDGNPVLLVSDFTRAQYLGRLDATFDENGVVTAYEGGPILLDNSVEKDAGIQARVEALAAPVTELMNLPVGTASVDLDGERSSCRFGECTMGNLITDAMLWSTATEGTQIALTNGGGIRASIPAGEVSLGDVLTVLPFGNLISTFEVSGAELVEALENGVSRAGNPENEGTGRFAQVSGLRYSWNPNQPAGARIVSVEVLNEDGSYSPIDMNATYKVASNDFVRNGGDDYQSFVGARNAYDFGAALDEAVARYITTFGPVAPELEGRVTMVEDGAAMMAGDAPAMDSGEGEVMMPEDMSCSEDYVVQADDWLSKIADKFYGDILAYPVIFDATNAAAEGSDTYSVIADPNVIEVGQTLCIPAVQ